MKKILLHKASLLLLLGLVSSFGGCSFFHAPEKKETTLITQEKIVKATSLTIRSIHGEATITEPVLLALLETPVMKRLIGINQGGICHFAKLDTPPFNRYEHSVDVFLLLRRYGASLEEQISGLLHDASHTVFSHVGDMVFKNQCTKSSYQDKIHEWFLKEYGIGKVLKEYGYEIDTILHKNGTFPLLEQDLPDLCADRVQYNYHTGYIDGLITADEVKSGYDHLHYKDGIWFFDNPVDAAKLGRISLYETINLWGAAWNLLIYDWTAQAMRRALAIGLINKDEIHFTMQDAAMWDRLIASKDPMIHYLMHKVSHYENEFSLISKAEYQKALKNKSLTVQNISFKFRGIDPLVMTEKGLERLTALDPAYAKEYHATKAQAQEGWYIAHKAIIEKGAEEQALFALAKPLILAQEGVTETKTAHLT